MDHRIVTIHASPKQLSKLRNGHAVRIKHGTGFNLIVHPENYHLISRAFNKNTGVQVRLTPEEIDANRSFSPEQHAKLQETQPETTGQGIFGKAGDKALKKLGIKKIAYKVGDIVKPHVKTAIKTGLTAGATALGAYAPELIPVLPYAVNATSMLANDYLDNPNKYYQSGIRAAPIRSIAEETAKAAMNEQLNAQLGTNYDYMSRAGLENAIAQEANARMNQLSIDGRFGQSPADYAELEGRGLYAGGMIHPHRRRVMDRSMMGKGTISTLHYMPPALISQPLSANFQFQHFLPPAFQHFNSGGGLYV